jgi:hypothetical protein
MILFVAGNSRSGTTMMSRILSNHPDVFAFHELHFFDEILSGRLSTQTVNREQALKYYATLCQRQRGGYFGKPQNPNECLHDAERETAALEHLTGLTVYEKFLHDETARNGKSIPCEQTPQNVFAMEQLLQALPGSRWILMVRDPRDVLLSQKYKWKRRALSGGKIPWTESLRARINYHPMIIPRIWNRVMSQIEKFKDHPRVLVVRYENLVADPDRTIREICAHAGITFQQAMNDIPVVGSSGAADTTGLRGIDARKSGQWIQGGLNPTEIALCEKISAAHFAPWGYQHSAAKMNPVRLFGYWMVLPCQLLITAAMNRKRLMRWLRKAG